MQSQTSTLVPGSIPPSAPVVKTDLPKVDFALINGNPIKKRSVVIGGIPSHSGHKTSVSLEDAFWCELLRLGREHGYAVTEMVTGIDNQVSAYKQNLSSTMRLWIFDTRRVAIEQRDAIIAKQDKEIVRLEKENGKLRAGITAIVDTGTGSEEARP